jgi:hypothetical protein
MTPFSLPDPGADWATPLATLRSLGWTLAVHNDYVQGGCLRTFWLLTRKGGASVKGEGLDDASALRACLPPFVEQVAPPGDGSAAVAALADLRAAGWQVALHNDYRLDGRGRTFWRLVQPSSGRFVDGEGDTDAEALLACLGATAVGHASVPA